MADGISGMPGTLVTTKSVGSLGNVIGGVPIGVANWIDVVFLDAFDNPLILNGDFYVAVANPGSASYDAFLHDESSAPSGRSVVYDPCDAIWIDESDPVHSSARNGNRMIRIGGFSLEPPAIVISRSGNDIQLNWNDLGTPYYIVYSSLDSDGPFSTLEGTVTTNSFTDVGAVAEEIKFYIVQSSVQP
jgi:hypothetical protein